jgi:hypothetical protein
LLTNDGLPVPNATVKYELKVNTPGAVLEYASVGEWFNDVEPNRHVDGVILLASCFATNLSFRMDRFVYISIDTSSVSVSVSGLDQTWVRGKIDILSDFFKARQPTAIYRTLLDSYTPLSGVLIGLGLGLLYVLVRLGSVLGSIFAGIFVLLLVLGVIRLFGKKPPFDLVRIELTDDPNQQGIESLVVPLFTVVGALAGIGGTVVAILSYLKSK